MSNSNRVGRGTGQLIHDRLTRVLSIAMAVIGAALVVRGAADGATTAVIVGVLFLAGGCGRLYLQLRLRRGRRG
jgi:hypothetical protein